MTLIIFTLHLKNLCTSGTLIGFLPALALDAQSRYRSGVQAFYSDIVTTLLALPEIALINFLEGLAYLGDQLSFPIPYA